ncbi:MAG: DUF4124 domain-containing protein [Steroidobacteraceae bacterium]
MPHDSFNRIARGPPAIALACAGAVCAALGCAGIALAGGSSAHGPLVYRWLDDHGVVHFGDSVPPRYAKRGATVLNDQGVVVGQLAAEQTPAQLAAAARAQQARAERKQRDTFLLTTYSSVEDIEQLRDQRIKQLESQLYASQQYIASLDDRLAALQARALHFKPYDADPTSRRMPDDLAEQLVRMLDDVRDQRAALAAKHREVGTIRAQFQADIDRYRELRAAPGSADPH